MNKLKYFLVIAVFVLSACIQNTSTTTPTPSGESPENPPAQQTAATTVAPPASETTEYTDISVPQLKDGKIFCYNEQVGKIQDGRIYLKLYDKVVSFEQTYLHGTDLDPGIEGLSCLPENLHDNSTADVGLSYYGLEISPRLYSPYSVYQTIETPEENQKITYKCDGSLVKKPKSDFGSDWGDYSKNVPYYYCETNGTDYLTQYEFEGASGYPVMTTGGEYGEYWRKIYIKKGSDLNYFFLGGLSFDSKMADVWFVGDSEEKYQQFTAKSFLDEILKSPAVTQSMALWDDIVKSFRVEPEGTII